MKGGGDKITVVRNRGDVIRARAKVPKSATGRFYWTANPRSGELYVNDEGLTWIREWHTPDAPVLRALLSASALAVPQSGVDWIQLGDFYTPVYR